MATTYKTQYKGQMSSADVKKMQQGLVDAGYGDMLGSSGVDGIWGANTSAALAQFKKDTGGSNSYGNSVGNETLQKLYGTGSSSGSSYNDLPVYNNGMSAAPQDSNILSQYAGLANAIANPNSLLNLNNVSAMASDINKLLAANPELYYGYLQYNNVNDSYKNQLGSLEAGTDQYITQLQSGAGNANAALDEARANALAGIKSTYDDSARNYYRLYKMQEKELPEQLSSVGATGGASESAALRLMNSYSDNMYKNETARNQDTNALNEDYYNAVANNSKQLASETANAYYQLAQNKANLQAQRDQAISGIFDGYYNQLMEKQNSNAQRSVANANANTDAQIASLKAAGYKVYTYTDADGYKQYTVGDSSSKKKVADNSSGGGKSVSASQAVYDNVYRNAQANMYGNSTYGMKTGGAEDAARYVQGQVNKTISETQAKSILKSLGLM